MKFSTLLKLFVIVFVFALAFESSTAEEKSKYPGEGEVAVGAALGAQGNFGGLFNYVMQENFHLGTFFGFYFDSGTNDDAKTFLVFSPYGRYFFDPIRNFRLFAQGSLIFESRSVATLDSQQKSVVRTVSTTGIDGAFGAEWAPYSSFSIFAYMSILQFQFDPSKIVAGLGNVTLGANFYLP